MNRRKELTISADYKLEVGSPIVFDFDSPNGTLAIVFEDDGETGYFYALDYSDDEQSIQEAMHIYNVANITDKSIPSIVRMAWSEDGAKALLWINGVPQAVFDFSAKRGYCRTNFPSPGKWKTHDFAWHDEALNAFL